MASEQVPGRWTAIVVAGRRPEGDPLAARFGKAYKGQISIHGETMLGRVVHTLLAAPSIARIVILAQEPDMLLEGELEWLKREPRVASAPSLEGISLSVAAIAGTAAAPWPVLVTTADHPLLTPDTIEEFLAGSANADVAVGVVERDTLLRRYPDNRRTWLKLRGGAFTGANLFALSAPNVQPALSLWSGVEQDRKKTRRLFWHFGPSLFLRALTRTISLEGALLRAGRTLGLVARPVVLSQAEAGIDVDKPEDVIIAERILGARAAA